MAAELAVVPDPAAALAAALAAVQAELPEIKKTRTARVEKDGRLLYTYDYADLADVSIAILPILGKHGLAFTAIPGHWPDRGGKFGLQYYLLHSGGAKIAGFYEIPEQGGIQMVGGRITYARRYCLCAVTGVAAEEDVDARDDGQQPSRTARRNQPSPGPETSAPVATARRRRAAAGDATSKPPGNRRPEGTGPGGEARTGSPQVAGTAPNAGAQPLPPLPGEETPAAGVPDETPVSGPAPAAGPDEPDGRDYDTPGTITPPMITAIWTVLSTVYAFGSDEKDQARAVCAHIIQHELTSTKDMSRNEAKAVLDTLANWQEVAERHEEEPRAFLIELMATAAKEAGGGDG